MGRETFEELSHGSRRRPWPPPALRETYDWSTWTAATFSVAYSSSWEDGFGCAGGRRRRNALKMWTGWLTFPMVFVKGVLIGVADDLEGSIQSGELKSMLVGTASQ